MEMCLINMLQQLITEGISEKSEETFEDFYNLNSKRYKKVKTNKKQENFLEQKNEKTLPMSYEEYLKCYRLKDVPEMKKFLKDSYENYLVLVKVLEQQVWELGIVVLQEELQIRLVLGNGQTHMQ